MACEPHQNPLRRSGTSQADRSLPGLSPDYVRIDERGYGDWIVFAAEFSKWLRFYDSANGASFQGWQAFFARDVSAVLGGLAVQDVDLWRWGVRRRLDFLRDDDHAGQDADLRRNLGELFSAAFTLARALDDFQFRLPGDLPFKAEVRRFVKTRLSPAFLRLAGYFQGAKSLGLYAAPDAPPGAGWRVGNLPLIDAGALLADSAAAAFSADWWDPAHGLASLADVPVDASVFSVPGASPSVQARLGHAANHFLFTSAFDQFTETYARLIADAGTALAGTLESMDSHQPHYALFLAFLRLFRTSQNRMNGLLRRHLDFYYKDILRLLPKGAEPDHVHLVAELAKSAPAASLPQGTLFKAGKDSAGNEVHYALDRETTFNKATAAAFQAVYRVDADDTWSDSALKTSHRYFAAPAMDSEDGLGAPLLSPSGEWHPFLNAVRDIDGALSGIRMPAARIGFAVASHYLFLAEGARVIRLRFGGGGFASFDRLKLACYLTHAKGWLEKTPQSIRSASFSGGGACTEIEIGLAGTDPAVAAWDAKTHGGEFAPGLPVVQCVLRNEDGPDYGYDDLKNVTVTAVEIEVRVGSGGTVYDATGAKEVLAANAGGNLDPSKPFQPWGPLPQNDSPFILGNSEVFAKRNARFNVHIAWANRPASISPSPSARLQFLEGGVWTDASASFTGGKACSAAKQRTFGSDVAVPEAALRDWRDPYVPYNPASRGGFLRLVLNGDFGQEAYQTSLTAFLIGKAAEAANPFAAVGGAAKFAEGIVHEVLDGAASLAQQGVDTVVGATGQIVDGAVGQVSEAIEGVGDAVKEGMETLGGSIGDALGSIGSKVGADVKDAGEAVGKMGADFAKKVGDVAGDLRKGGEALAEKAIQSGPGAVIGQAQMAMQAAPAGAASQASAVSSLPPKPYLPVVDAVHIGYTAATGAVDLTTLDAETFAARAVRVFHLGTFGEAELDFPETEGAGQPLVPQFRFPGGADHIGEWMIGFRDLAPRQSVDVLIQVLDGSTLPTLSKPVDHVTWSYWNGRGWTPFAEGDVSDGTGQLIRSGIVRFSIPDDAAADRGVMPHGLIWVMASVDAAVGAVCKVLSVKAQALEATLLLPGVAPDFLDAPLPAGTISKLKTPDARFKKFEQPFASFGGRQTETSARFYLRSSERLRHKGRAATIWDYEALVLEAFPAVYKVKCLNHTRIEDNPDSALAVHNENAPGHVSLIAIPVVAAPADGAGAGTGAAVGSASGTAAGLMNPLKPYASEDLLGAIRDYLRERVAGQLISGLAEVNVHVCNPLFEEIILEFALQLKEGYDDFTWYSRRLQDEIVRHLAPWAFAAPGAAVDVQFGGRIAKSSLIDFIEERPYVDFITDVVLKRKAGNAPVSGDLEEAAATTSRSVLVPAPAAQHLIRRYGT